MARLFHSFVLRWPWWPIKSYMSLLSSSSIYYWLIYNVCKSDTSGNRLKVPFAVTRHILPSLSSGLTITGAMVGAFIGGDGVMTSNPWPCSILAASPAPVTLVVVPVSIVGGADSKGLSVASGGGPEDKIIPLLYICQEFSTVVSDLILVCWWQCKAK